MIDCRVVPNVLARLVTIQSDSDSRTGEALEGFDNCHQSFFFIRIRQEPFIVVCACELQHSRISQKMTEGRTHIPPAFQSSCNGLQAQDKTSIDLEVAQSWDVVR